MKQIKCRLQNLAPKMMDLIYSYAAGKEPNIDKGRIDSAWKIIEHAKGRPAQDVNLGNQDGEPLVIKVIYEDGPGAGDK